MYGEHQRRKAEQDNVDASRHHISAIDEAIRRAEALMGQGEYAEALKVLKVATAGATEKEKEQLAQRVVLCALGLGNGDESLGAWEEVQELQPDLRFPQTVEVTMSQAFKRELLREHKTLVEAVEQESDKAGVLARRMEWALAGPDITDKAREEMEADLAVINDHFHPKATPPAVAVEDDKGLRVRPVKDPSKQEDDIDPTAEIRSLLEIGKACKLPEESRKALAAYKQARAKAARAFPVYSCPFYKGHGRGDCEAPSDWEDTAPEFGLLLETQRAVESVAPNEPSPLRGGVILHVDMKEAPKGWMPGFTVDVWQPGHEKAKQQCRAYVHSNGIARIGVADGTYGFAFLFSDMACTTPEAEQAMDGMEVEVPDLPDKIVVDGAWVDLPPMQVHRHR